MNYLSHSTLKAFLYLLYGKSSLLLFNFKYPERESIIQDIFSDNLESLFFFKNSEGTIERASLEDMSEILYDISPNIKTLEIILPSSNEGKLLDFINSYVNDFKNGDVFPKKNNYYPFKQSYQLSMEKLKKYKEFGKKINIKIPLNDESKYTFYKNEVRFIDVLFYFLSKKYIEINTSEIEKILYEVSDDYYETEILLPMTLVFNRTLEEISDIEGSWIGYGNDIKLNLLEHIAYYKSNYYKFKSTNTKSFKLLKMLIESRGDPILIIDVYSLLNPTDKHKSEYFEEEKKMIINLIKDLKKKLKITKDKNPTVKISVTGKEIFLIANTPICTL